MQGKCPEMSNDKTAPNPDELQPQYLSDEDAERMIKNYAAQQELENFDPDKLDWQPMNKEKPKTEDSGK